MSTKKQSKNTPRRNILSFLFRTSPKKGEYIQQAPKATKPKIVMDDKEVEFLEQYYSEESIVTSLECLETIDALKKRHNERLAQEKSIISDLDKFVITEGDLVLSNILNRWGKSTKNSIENLDETLEKFYDEKFEPTACFYLNRSIVHLVNIYETISVISNMPQEKYKTSMCGYLYIIKNCISSFRTDFIKFCREISSYISDLKQTLTLLVNRHPENRLVIHAMGDIERLYNFAFDNINNVDTSTPSELNMSIRNIDKISNDINDIKYDLINIKHHQDKDIKYVTSSYA
jgi:hypothetical protein